MSLDHGILNIPLSKRGNFDKELDDYLAAEKRKKSEELWLRKAAFNDALKESKRLYALMDKALIKADAKRRGMKFSELREVLKDIRDYKPQLAPKAFSSYIAQ